ncbi:MAG: hypothetical protein AAFS10_25980 [Myxococcota bacterium]
MSTPPSQNPLQIHLVAITIGAVVVLLGLGAYSLRRILFWINGVHHVFVFLFLAVVAVWGYWVTSALLRRRLARLEQQQPTPTAPKRRPPESTHG